MRSKNLQEEVALERQCFLALQGCQEFDAFSPFLWKKPGEFKVRLVLVLTPQTYILPGASQWFALHHCFPM